MFSLNFTTACLKVLFFRSHCQVRIQLSLDSPYLLLKLISGMIVKESDVPKASWCPDVFRKILSVIYQELGKSG